MKKLHLLSLIIIPFLASCTPKPSGNNNKEEEKHNQIIYTDEIAYDYDLEDDERHGTAIYPNQALIMLKQIEAHNREVGFESFFNASYRSFIEDMIISGEMQGEYIVEEENYIPGQYYFHEKNEYFLKQTATGFFYDDYETPNEFFYGQNDVEDLENSYYTPSTVEAMTSYVEEHRVVEDHYEWFLNLTKKIANDTLKNIRDPQAIKCYTSGEGSLYINYYRIHNDYSNRSVREIYRIIYRDYKPIFATYQNVSGILGDEDYYTRIEVASFRYADIEIEENLQSYFHERRD